MKLPWFSLLNLGPTRPLEIMIYGLIGDPEQGLDAASLVNAITAAGDRPLRLRMASDGGDVPSAVAIYNALSRYPGPTEADIEGWVCSSATWIAMACKTVRMAENAQFMIHNCGNIVVGGAEDMHRAAALMGNVDEMIAKTYAARTKLPLAQIQQMMDAETWLTAAECKAMGFVDEVTAALRMAASFDTHKFRNAPNTAASPTMKFLPATLAAFIANLTGSAIKEDSAEPEVTNALSALVKKADLDAEKLKVTNLLTELTAEKSKLTDLSTALTGEQTKVANLTGELTVEKTKIANLTTQQANNQRLIDLLEAHCGVKGVALESAVQNIIKPADKKQLPYAEYAKLSPTAKAEFIKSGGQFLD